MASPVHSLRRHSLDYSTLMGRQSPLSLFYTALATAEPQALGLDWSAQQQQQQQQPTMSSSPHGQPEYHQQLPWQEAAACSPTVVDDSDMLDAGHVHTSGAASASASNDRALQSDAAAASRPQQTRQLGLDSSPQTQNRMMAPQRQQPQRKWLLQRREQQAGAAAGASPLYQPQLLHSPNGPGWESAAGAGMPTSTPSSNLMHGGGGGGPSSASSSSPSPKRQHLMNGELGEAGVQDMEEQQHHQHQQYGTGGGPSFGSFAATSFGELCTSRSLPHQHTPTPSHHLPQPHAAADPADAAAAGVSVDDKAYMALWLAHHKLSDCFSVLSEQEITLSMLVNGDISEEELKSVGISKLGVRRKLMLTVKSDVELLQRRTTRQIFHPQLQQQQPQVQQHQQQSFPHQHSQLASCAHAPTPLGEPSYNSNGGLSAAAASSCSSASPVAASSDAGAVVDMMDEVEPLDSGAPDFTPSGDQLQWVSCPNLMHKFSEDTSPGAPRECLLFARRRPMTSTPESAKFDRELNDILQLLSPSPSPSPNPTSHIPSQRAATETVCFKCGNCNNFSHHFPISIFGKDHRSHVAKLRGHFTEGCLWTVRQKLVDTPWRLISQLFPQHNTIAHLQMDQAPLQHSDDLHDVQPVNAFVAARVQWTATSHVHPHAAVSQQALQQLQAPKLNLISDSDDDSDVEVLHVQQQALQQQAPDSDLMNNDDSDVEVLAQLPEVTKTSRGRRRSTVRKAATKDPVLIQDITTLPWDEIDRLCHTYHFHPVQGKPDPELLQLRGNRKVIRQDSSSPGLFYQLCTADVFMEGAGSGEVPPQRWLDQWINLHYLRLVSLPSDQQSPVVNLVDKKSRKRKQVETIAQTPHVTPMAPAYPLFQRLHYLLHEQANRRRPTLNALLLSDVNLKSSLRSDLHNGLLDLIQCSCAPAYWNFERCRIMKQSDLEDLWLPMARNPRIVTWLFGGNVVPTQTSVNTFVEAIHARRTMCYRREKWCTELQKQLSSDSDNGARGKTVQSIIDEWFPRVEPCHALDRLIGGGSDVSPSSCSSLPSSSSNSSNSNGSSSSSSSGSNDGGGLGGDLGPGMMPLRHGAAVESPVFQGMYDESSDELGIPMLPTVTSPIARSISPFRSTSNRSDFSFAPADSEHGAATSSSAIASSSHAATPPTAASFPPPPVASVAAERSSWPHIQRLSLGAVNPRREMDNAAATPAAAAPSDAAADKLVAELLDMQEKHEPVLDLCVLQLAGFHIKLDTWTAIINCMQDHVWTLSLRQTQLNDDMASAITTWLNEPKRWVEVLDLSNNQISCLGAIHLGTSLATGAVSFCNLRRNCIGILGARSLNHVVSDGDQVRASHRAQQHLLEELHVEVQPTSPAPSCLAKILDEWNVLTLPLLQHLNRNQLLREVMVSLLQSAQWRGVGFILRLYDVHDAVNEESASHEALNKPWLPGRSILRYVCPNVIAEVPDRDDPLMSMHSDERCNAEHYLRLTAKNRARNVKSKQVEQVQEAAAAAGDS